MWDKRSFLKQRCLLLTLKENIWWLKLHLLRTPNEGINQINLKIWANVADEIIKKLGVGAGVDFRLCNEGDFLAGRP